VTARLVAIEGIDGSGKGTQAARLRDSLTRDGFSCGLIAFPRYSETTFGRTIARYLNGEFGDLQAAGPHFAALLYAGDRYESQPLISSELATRDVLIFDRYVPSNLAHQAAKLPSGERAAFIEWLQSIEYGVYRLPRPDLVIYLDMPVRQAQQLIALKPARTYTTKRADLHESDGDYLGRTADVYSQLSQSDRTWKVVPCTSQDAVRAVDEIAAEIHDRVREILHAKSM
jgi:dTMP kinase